ncbi:hypothetical protein M1116_02895 [Patescibacteria group bacterium]|nr:hypothetical protein [Patescibacteria group bacterium]
MDKIEGSVLDSVDWSNYFATSQVKTKGSNKPLDVQIAEAEALAHPQLEVTKREPRITLVTQAMSLINRQLVNWKAKLVAAAHAETVMDTIEFGRMQIRALPGDPESLSEPEII